ncbi:ORF87 [Agrotis segetum granulovirus]|uniref:ORF87 n=1 Tax=Agrotis segetum granulosis virus TaxID=10464 RepID=Q6QXM7_GVAS|nr:odv-ec27 [Agrotis segetum granulovirus]AAS82651.1 ORF87 [Agrotis segetum granulovirus]AHN92138.1 odv-ec27 [Agrotis segetum granulovirus]AKN63375.1 odv-ec27 [Agrotis segetum granulovirus]
MNRTRTIGREGERKVENYRTVTEITDAENSYSKRYDVSDLVNKNEAYQRQQEKREMYLMLSKYVAMVLDLKLPDLKILFGSNGTPEAILSLVYHSLAFVNTQMFPHSTRFVDMRFIITSERKFAIPGEPIVFYRSINPDDDQTVVCFVDRPGILRVLEKPVDVNVVFEENDCKNEYMTKLFDRIKSTEHAAPVNPYERFITNEFVCNLNESNLKMDEGYITQFVILLILFTNAYIGYYKLVRTDFRQYFDFLLNHESLIRDQSALPNLCNLFTSKFSFSVQGEEGKKPSSGLIFKKFD